MMTSTRAFVVAISILGCASFAQAQELAPGTWTGTVRNPTAALRNANSRPASIVIKKVPDPHWRWRATGDVTVATLVVPMASYELSGIVLKNDRLSFSFVSPAKDEPVRCNLTRQADGSFEGDCVGGDFNRRVMLNPPTESK